LKCFGFIKELDKNQSWLYLRIVAIVVEGGALLASHLGNSAPNDNEACRPAHGGKTEAREITRLWSGTQLGCDVSEHFVNAAVRVDEKDRFPPVDCSLGRLDGKIDLAFVRRPQALQPIRTSLLGTYSRLQSS
jgi:hypothetical protein